MTLITPDWLTFVPYCPSCGYRGISYTYTRRGALKGHISNEYYSCDRCGVEWEMQTDPERGYERSGEWADTLTEAE